MKQLQYPVLLAVLWVMHNMHLILSLLTKQHLLFHCNTVHNKDGTTVFVEI